MILYRVNKNPNTYCGPSALSALAGIGTKEAAAIIRRVNPNKERVVGTSHGDMVSSLSLLGFSARRVVVDERRSLGNWARKNARGKNVYLVSAGRHWIVVQGKYAICGKTVELVPISEHPNVRTFVVNVFSIERVKKVDPATLAPAPKKRTGRYAMTLAKKLANEFSVDVEQFDKDSSIFVDPPTDLFKRDDDDPYYDQHYCETWEDALDRVRTYVEIIKGCSLPGPSK